MKINKEILKSLFIDLYEFQNKKMPGIHDKCIFFMKKQNNIKEYGVDDNGDPYISLFEDDDNIIEHNIKYDSYLKYVKIYREEKLKRILE